MEKSRNFKIILSAGIDFILLLIKSLRIIFGLNHRTCRFYPTCSHYSSKAFEKYGLAKGIYLSLKRILKCHPFDAGGYDPP